MGRRVDHVVGNKRQLVHLNMIKIDLISVGTENIYYLMPARELYLVLPNVALLP